MPGDRLAIGPTEFRFRAAEQDEIDAAFPDDDEGVSQDTIATPEYELKQQRA